MALVVICSPLRNDDPDEVERNRVYAREAMRNSMLRGEAPFVSHLLYPQILEDSIPEERAAAKIATEQVIMRADRLAVYIDRGISDGMREEIRVASVSNTRVVFRTMKKPSEDLPFARQAQGKPINLEDFENAQSETDAESGPASAAAKTGADADGEDSGDGATIIPLRRS